MTISPDNKRMVLRNWCHKLIDLATDGYVDNPGLSVLANAVECLNLRLLTRLEEGSRLLEIGCGVHSLLKEGIREPSAWEGIDVIEVDRNGKRSIATKNASVEDIPWPSSTFDYVVSNQSIEHWHEYGVSLAQGLSEIHRVLKPGGRAVINFPIHLHGHRIFLTGDFAAIDTAFAEAGLEVISRVAVINSKLPAYRGWRMCGFPDFLVKTFSVYETTSFVVEYVSVRHGTDDRERNSKARAARPKVGRIGRTLHYGFKYAAWKSAARMLARDRAK